MKIYTVKYDANRPSLKQVNIPNNSNSKIGIEVISNNEKIELTKDNVKLTSGDTTLYADGEYSGYVTFPITTGDCSDDKAYTLSCEKAPEKYEETLSVQFMPMVAVNLDFPFDKEIQSKVNGLEFNLFDFKWTVSINGQVDSKTGGLDYIMYKDSSSDKSWKYLFSKKKINGIFHWKNNITGKISDTVVYPDDFAGKEIIILRTAPETSLGPREDRIGDVTLTNANIGKPFKQNFNLLVNSIKSSICEEEKELKTVISETTYCKFEPETSADYLTYTSTSGGANLSCVIKGFTIDKTTNQINHLKLDAIGQQGSGQPTVKSYDTNITIDTTTYYIMAGEAIVGSIKYDRVNDTLKFGGESTPTAFSKALADKDPVVKILSVENVDYNTANVIDESTDKIPNNKAVKDYIDNKISVASGNTPKVFQAFQETDYNNTVDVKGIKVGDIILASSNTKAITILHCGPEFGYNTIYKDEGSTANNVFSGVIVSIFDTPQQTQIVVACGDTYATFSGNKGE